MCKHTWRTLLEPKSDMVPKARLGRTIRKLRLKAEITLRELSRRVKVSAAHMSDVEKERRMPSDDLLRRIAEELAHVGAQYEEMRLLKPRIEDDVERWYAEDPEVRVLFREAKDSGLSAREMLAGLRRAAERGKRSED